MKKNFKLFAVLALALVVLASCNRTKNENEENMEPLFAVNTYKTKFGNLDDYLEFGGDVVARSSVAVLPDMAGKITRVLVNVGQEVERNQTIAYVDASMPGVYYSASPVRAPITGRVISFIPTVGTMVSQGSVIAQIADTDELEIKVSVPERFIKRIEKDQQAVVTFDAYPGESFEATVFEVSPVLDTSSRTMNIKLRLVQHDDKVKVGMYARVRLITQSIKDAIIVPSNAIVTRDGKTYLFVIGSRLEDGHAKVKLVQVKQGITVDNKTEIEQGISAGDEVVVKGQNLLDDNSTVNIISVKED